MSNIARGFRHPATRVCQRREDVVQRVRIEIGGDRLWGRLEGDRVITDDGRELAAADVGWLAPVAPSKIIAVHLTYRSRLLEYAVARMPAQPSYFIKPPSTLNGHLRALRRPAGTRFLNYEGELAVVVGTRMHGVAERDVLDHVYGFAPANDVGLHDFRHADRGAMLRVKGQDGFLPIGPAVVTTDQWRPDDGYTLRTRLNGEVVQEADADDLIWDYRYQLADLCRLITLEPGDVILTGTPANSRPMEPGDVVEVEIAGLPALRNHVENWDVDLSGPGEQPEVSANTLHVALAIAEDEAERIAAEGRQR
jgi:5-oxopent-3-ene-1,2,5-tricarboxylate decarboxylase/2-hydroxyhepta-2,4-diene-1,7-dioate isomerase